MIIQGLWIGSSLSQYEYNSIKSWLDNGFEYHLYVYEPIGNIPINTIIKDGNDIIPFEELKLYRDCYSVFSDVFRYKLLYLKGNAWVDCDLYCIRHFKTDTPYKFLSEKTIKEGAFRSKLPYNVLNSFIYIKDANMDFALELYTKAKQYYDKLETKKQSCKNVGLDAYKWLGGGKLLKKMIDKYELMDYIADYKFGFPIPWWHFNKLFQSGITTFNISRGWNLEVNLETIFEDQEIKFITIHNGWIKNKGINKDKALVNCFMSRLFSRISSSN